MKNILDKTFPFVNIKSSIVGNEIFIKIKWIYEYNITNIIDKNTDEIIKIILVNLQIDYSSKYK